MRTFFLALLLWGAAPGFFAAQIRLDFSQDKTGQPPPGFSSLVTGTGAPSNWKIVDEQVPRMLAPLLTNSSSSTALRAILTVQSFDLDEKHYPILLYTNEIFDDFTFITRFKIGGGVVEPSAGVIFRAQDQSNYYVVRASSEGNLLWYRVVNGHSYENLGIGVKLAMPPDVWQELRITCQGSQIRCYLNGRLTLPPARADAPTNTVAINDTTFRRGEVGYWTKADSRAYFVDGLVQYNQRVPYVQVVINNVYRRYPHLLGLKVYAVKISGLPVVIGSMSNEAMGEEGGKTEADVIDRGSIYYLKNSKFVEVTLPLRDRNGEVSAAIKIKMKTFKGETQSNAIARAAIVKKAIEEQLDTMHDING